MRKETVSYRNLQTDEVVEAQVDIYDNLAEATKALGEKGCLEAINSGIVEKGQRKLRHTGQLKRAQGKRALDAAMRKFAQDKGFDPSKIKV